MIGLRYPNKQCFYEGENGMKRSAIRRTPMRRKPRAIGVNLEWQSEKDFQKQVEDLAAMCGYMTSHAHLPYFDTAGIPDLLIVHPQTGRTIFAELKTRTKTNRLPKPPPAQQRWLNALGIKNEVYVWTHPDSWPEIEAVFGVTEAKGEPVAARGGQR